jgi:anti-sigma factor RsiW
MRDCENIRESIGRWLDGELSPGESETVRAHVADCAQCSEARRQLEKIQLALKGALLAEAQKIEFAPFWRAVEHRIAEKRAWYEDALDWARGIFTVSRAAWAVPAVIALLLAVLSLDAYLPGWRGGHARNSFATVESIDAYGRNVALLREYNTKTTVIWLYENQEGDNEAAEEAPESAPAF